MFPLTCFRVFSVSILVVVDGPLRHGERRNRKRLSRGFNPCCRGWTSEAGRREVCNPGRAPVSILVVVDGPLRLGDQAEQEIIEKMFQSLLSWMDL